jgi:hypothetical protein
MKKSKMVSLVLISAALASCNKNDLANENKKVYMRSDTTAPYSRAHPTGGGGSSLAAGMLWFYAFRPYGSYSGGNYNRAGYYSSGLKESSNLGHNTTKKGIVKGGFGHSGYSVSS